MAEEAVPRGRERRAEVARKLKDQGLKLIAARGLHACRVEEITRAVGVGKGTFFTHFATKDHFVAALVDHVLSDLVRRVRPVTLSPDGAEALLAGVGAVHLRYFQLRPEAAALLVQAVSLDPESPARTLVQGRLAAHLSEVAGLIAPAGRELGWPADRMDDLALMLLANSCGFFWFSRDLPALQDTPVQLLERLGRALAKGLSA
ncbi:MAG: TetR/AcrR family transcriptional regulator [Deltaproteobacteria bacterium]|nr:TetR/AcrR family transcriptional regulator [Deltaproteobacteria bacterium]